jgi:hypothetical protein
MFKRFLLAGTILAACGASSAYAGCTSGLPGHAGGPPTGTTFGSGLDDLNWANDCSSTENAFKIEGKTTDDDQLFTDKITGSGQSSPEESTTLSFEKNSPNPNNQNVFLESVTRGSGLTISGGSITGITVLSHGVDQADPFTEGNGFANIKSVSDQTQEFVIDPDVPLGVFGKGNTPFPGFDGLYLRGQLSDFCATGTTCTKVTGPDTGTVTFAVDLFNPGLGTHLTDIYTYTGVKVGTPDFGALGFDENDGALPSGYLVDQVIVETDSAHAFDQIKQIGISVPGFSPPTIPETRTWVMLLLGFGLMGSVGYWRRRSVAIAD